MRRPPDHEAPDLDDSTDPIGAAIAATAATIAAPVSLRESVRRDQGRARRRRTRGRVLGGGLAAIATLTAIALLLVLPGADPSVADAAKLALAAPNAAPPSAGATPGTLDASVSGVAFPTWKGWKVVGERDQDVRGRSARSVVYESPSGKRVGYAIVSGKALDVPEGTRHRVGGTELTSLHTDGATVVTWRVAGHTCVLATQDDVSVDGLVRFAATSY